MKKWSVIAYEYGEKFSFVCESKEEAIKLANEKKNDVNQFLIAIAVVYSTIDEDGEVSPDYDEFIEIKSDK